MTRPAIKITAILGAFILLAGAAFHMSGMGQLKVATQPIESDFFKNALVGLWTTTSIHWLFIAFLSVGLARYKSNACAAILLAFGVLILVDALLIFMSVGLFLGAYMLGLAGLLLLASGLMLRKDIRTGG